MIDKTIGEMMEEFHRTFDIGYGEYNRNRIDTLILRRKLIKEEYEEVLEEVDKLLLLEAEYEQLDPWDDEKVASVCTSIDEHDRRLLKELCDLVYVTAGFAHVRSFNFDGAMQAVHNSNMSKIGEDGQVLRREDGKIMKGPNYKPARMEAYI